MSSPSILPPPPYVWPIAPARQEVLTMQDYINLIPWFPGNGLYRPTPLCPVPPTSLMALNIYAYGQVHHLGDFSNGLPGGNAYVFIDKAKWLQLQLQCYGGTLPADVAAANAALFAEQDAANSPHHYRNRTA